MPIAIILGCLSFVKALSVIVTLIITLLLPHGKKPSRKKRQRKKRLMRSRILGLLCFLLAALTCSGRALPWLWEPEPIRFRPMSLLQPMSLIRKPESICCCGCKCITAGTLTGLIPVMPKLPTGIKWSLPEGYEIETREQSLPQKFVVDGLVQYGYDQTAYWKFRLKTQRESDKKIRCGRFSGNRFLAGVP